MNTPADAQVTIVFEGSQYRVPRGITVAAAVLGHAGANDTGVHPLAGDRRGPFCMMGVCFECLVTINGAPNQQACLTLVADGMRISRQIPGAEEQ